MKRFILCILLITFISCATVPLCGFSKGFEVTLCCDEEEESAAFNYGGLTLWDRLKGVNHADKYAALTAAGMDEASALNEVAAGLGDFVKRVSAKYYVAPTCAEVTFNAGQKEPFSYVQERDGSRVDESRLCADIAKALGAKSIAVTLSTQPLKAFLTEEKLRNATRLISTFSTNYASSSAARKNNVKVAVSKVNGTILYDKATFSFNNTVGARTVANGFAAAPIIVNGRFTEGVGGGVCQVSTTLYNAALKAGLTVNKVNRHSLSVGYVKPSFDAMVSSVSDLVFTNETGMPVYITATADGSKLTVKMYGLSCGYEIRLKSVVKRVIPYGGTVVEDAALPEGERRVVTAGKNGLVSEGYICYIKDDVIEDCKKIRSDVYSAVDEEIIIGTLPQISEIPVD